MSERSRFIFDTGHRPCYVDGKKAMFHQWINRAQVAPPSMMIGGHPGGQLWEVFGLVEFEDGHVGEAYPNNIVFADGGGFEHALFRSMEKVM